MNLLDLRKFVAPEYVFGLDARLHKTAERELRKSQRFLAGLFEHSGALMLVAHQGVLDEGVDFLQKPFTLLSLAEKVRKVLSQPAA